MPSLGLKICVPVTSPGSMSGVNWMREKCASRASASVEISQRLGQAGRATPADSRWRSVVLSHQDLAHLGSNRVEALLNPCRDSSPCLPSRLHSRSPVASGPLGPIDRMSSYCHSPKSESGARARAPAAILARSSKDELARDDPSGSPRDRSPSGAARLFSHKIPSAQFEAPGGTWPEPAADRASAAYSGR